MMKATVGSPFHHARWCVLALSLLAIGLCVATVVQVVKRVLFPYDFGIWPDDYVLNELLKMRLGAPIYGSYDDANSFIYAPGGVLLHHALLSPWGLDLDIVANRVLAQCWLLFAVVLGLRLVPWISEGRARASGRIESIAAVLGACAVLVLAGYSSPLAETLHPTTLELLTLTIAATVAARWPLYSPRARIMLALITPACAMLAKQTGGSVAFALAACALLTKIGSPRQRLISAAACLASPALAFVALQIATHGAFARWGLLLLLRQPRLWTNTVYLPASLSALAPLLVLVCTRGAQAFERRELDPNAAWLRVATVPAAYLPAAMLAFLKMGGGSFDFSVLAFLAAPLAMAQVLTSLRSNAMYPGLGPVLPALIAGTQLLLWWPSRHTPTAADEAWNFQKCAHIREALACGERLLVDEGTSCLVRGGIKSPPRDRGFTIMELAWAGLRDAGGTGRRLAAEHYDLLALHAIPMPGPWSDRAVKAMARHYTIYKAIAPPPALAPGDPDRNERARFNDWPVLLTILLERTRDAGRHRLEIIGPPRCKPAVLR